MDIIQLSRPETPPEGMIPVNCDIRGENTDSIRIYRGTVDHKGRDEMTWLRRDQTVILRDGRLCVDAEHARNRGIL